jgi:hypothetical protein
MNKFCKIVALSSLALALGACEVEKTEEGSLPEVDAQGGNLPEYETIQTEEGEMPSVDVEGGNMPEYDVETADMSVDMEPVVISVPDVDVTMPDEKKDKDNERNPDNMD